MLPVFSAVRYLSENYTVIIMKSTKSGDTVPEATGLDDGWRRKPGSRLKKGTSEGQKKATVHRAVAFHACQQLQEVLPHPPPSDFSLDLMENPEP